MRRAVASGPPRTAGVPQSPRERRRPPGGGPGPRPCPHPPAGEPRQPSDRL